MLMWQYNVFGQSSHLAAVNFNPYPSIIKVELHKLI